MEKRFQRSVRQVVAALQNEEIDTRQLSRWLRAQARKKERQRTTKGLSSVSPSKKEASGFFAFAAARRGEYAHLLPKARAVELGKAWRQLDAVEKQAWQKGGSFPVQKQDARMVASESVHDASRSSETPVGHQHGTGVAP